MATNVLRIGKNSILFYIATAALFLGFMPVMDLVGKLQSYRCPTATCSFEMSWDAVWAQWEYMWYVKTLFAVPAFAPSVLVVGLTLATLHAWMSTGPGTRGSRPVLEYSPHTVSDLQGVARWARANTRLEGVVASFNAVEHMGALLGGDGKLRSFHVSDLVRVGEQQVLPVVKAGTVVQYEELAGDYAHDRARRVQVM